MTHPASAATVRFAGVVPPVLTPLNTDGTVDHTSLARHVEYLIGAGVSGLFALGSTGETAYLTDTQRVEVARTIVDTIVTTAPLYTLNSATEIADHFRAIAAAIDVPLWAYDVPVRVHTKLGLGLLMELAAEGVIQGVKDSSGDDVGFVRLVAANEAAGRPLQLLTGHEMVVDAMLLAGADGVVPGFANVEAEGYVRLWNAAARGDWDEARTEQKRINQLFELVFLPIGLSGDATGVGAFKAAMVARGLIDNATVSPGVESLDSAAVSSIRALLAAHDLLPA